MIPYVDFVVVEGKMVVDFVVEMDMVVDFVVEVDMDVGFEAYKYLNG
jgi:hypothetical protein